MRYIIYKLIFIIQIFALTTVYGQNPKYQLAKSYEEGGDFKNSARLYSELLDANPQNDEYFDGIVRSYYGLNRFSDLAPLVKNRLEAKPSAKLYAIYGDLLWRTGFPKEADKAWDDALKKYPDMPETYNFVAQIQSKTSQFEKAIATLLKGRYQLGNDAMFSSELCHLYIAVGNYKDGTKEILKTFYLTGDISQAEGQLYAFMVQEIASNYILNYFRQEVGSNSRSLPLQMLYGWLLRTAGRFDDALDVFKRIDELSNAQGRELLSFSDISRNDGQLDIALKGYGLIIDQGKSNRYIQSALYGYTKTLEMKLQVESKFSRQEIEKIIQRYRSIISDFPKHPIAADCMFRIGELAMNNLSDLDMAIEEFNLLAIQFPNIKLAAAALNNLGTINILKDKLNDALKYFTVVAGRYQTVAPEESDFAEYKLGEIDYYSGKMDSAKSKFESISLKSGSNASNDALDKMLIINQNEQFVKPLADFAKAQLRQYQKRYGEALALYKSVCDLADGEDLAEQSIVNSAQIEFSQMNYLQAREFTGKLFEKYPESIYGDRALLLEGNCYLAEMNKDAALKVYTDFLVRFPTSIYIDEAREKIRRIRNEKI